MNIIKRSTECHENLRKEVMTDSVARSEYEAFKLQLKLTAKPECAKKTYHTKEGGTES